MKMELLIANMRSWFYSQHISSEAIFGGIILAIVVVAVLLKFFKPPKV
jgi:hypothetical protein